MKINKRNIDGQTEYRVEDDGVAITLSCHEGEEKPKVFGFYIWDFFAKHDEKKMKEIIEKITGIEVDRVGIYSGNGHGDVTVTYS